MHIHRGMKVDVDKVIDIFAQMHPRRMQLTNVLHSTLLITFKSNFSSQSSGIVCGGKGL